MKHSFFPISVNFVLCNVVPQTCNPYSLSITFFSCPQDVKKDVGILFFQTQWWLPECRGHCPTSTSPPEICLQRLSDHVGAGRRLHFFLVTARCPLSCSFLTVPTKMQNCVSFVFPLLVISLELWTHGRVERALLISTLWWWALTWVLLVQLSARLEPMSGSPQDSLPTPGLGWGAKAIPGISTAGNEAPSLPDLFERFFWGTSVLIWEGSWPLVPYHERQLMSLLQITHSLFLLPVFLFFKRTLLLFIPLCIQPVLMNSSNGPHTVPDTKDTVNKTDKCPGLMELACRW